MVPGKGSPGGTTDSRKIFRVVFHNQGKIYEIYAREVRHGDLMGFVEVGDLLFGERSSVVVDPAEEKLRTEFEGVSRFHVPMHAVVRIDEVDQRGTARISDCGDAKVTPFPGGYPGPGGNNPGSGN